MRLHSSDATHRETACQAVFGIERGRTLQKAFRPILLALVSSSQSPAVALRSKSLRGLSAIVTADADVLDIVGVSARVTLNIRKRSGARSKIGFWTILRRFETLPSSS